MGDAIEYEISKLNQRFDIAAKLLSEYCKSRIKYIINMKININVGNFRIINIIKYYNTEYAKLKNKLKLEIQNVENKYLVLLAPVVVAPVVVAPVVVAPVVVAPVVVAPVLIEAPVVVAPVLIEAPVVVAPVRKTKKALLIGCNYLGTENELLGCINDAENIKNVLKNIYKFDTIDIMTDNTIIKPTKKNILDGFKNMLINSSPGDTLFLSFSGHGSRSIDKNGDELSVFDSMFFCLDEKFIVDDEIKLVIDSNLKKDISLFALFDSCYSGTVMDLRYQYLDSGNSDKTTINEKETETIGDVVMISGCTDEQTSLETSDAQGAMTSAFLNSPHSKTMSWNKLILSMRFYLKYLKYSQIPQITSGKKLDLNSIVSFI